MRKSETSFEYDSRVQVAFHNEFWAVICHLWRQRINVNGSVVIRHLTSISVRYIYLGCVWKLLFLWYWSQYQKLNAKRHFVVWHLLLWMFVEYITFRNRCTSNEAKKFGVDNWPHAVHHKWSKVSPRYCRIKALHVQKRRKWSFASKSGHYRDKQNGLKSGQFGRMTQGNVRMNSQKNKVTFTGSTAYTKKPRCSSLKVFLQT